MDVATRVIDGVEYEVVFDGRQELSRAGSFGSTLGPQWIASGPPPRQRGERRGRKRARGWHQVSTKQRARIQRELQGE